MYIVVKDSSSDFDNSVKYCFSKLVRHLKQPVSFSGTFSSENGYSKFIDDDFVSKFSQTLTLKTLAPTKIDKSVINHISIRKQKRSTHYRYGKERVEDFLKTSSTETDRRGLMPSFNHLLSDEYVSYYIDIESLDEDLNLIEIPFGTIEPGKLQTYLYRKPEQYNKTEQKYIKTYYHVFQD